MKKITDQACIFVPKVLFYDSDYKALPLEAKLMYSILLDRESLSKKNGWVDENGETFVYYTVEEMAKILNYSEPKIVKLFKILSEYGLITRGSAIPGKPAKIIVHRITKFKPSDLQNFNPSDKEASTERFKNFNTNKPYLNKTEMNNSFPLPTYEEVKEKIHEQISYEEICCSHGQEFVDSVVSLICDTLCSNAAEIKICGTNYPISVVRKRLFSLNELHIAYAYDVMEDTKEKIVNIRQYLLSVLFNAPSTMESYYVMRVNREVFS